jgi:hypothetical protein
LGWAGVGHEIARHGERYTLLHDITVRGLGSRGHVEQRTSQATWLTPDMRPGQEMKDARLACRAETGESKDDGDQPGHRR